MRIKGWTFFCKKILWKHARLNRGLAFFEFRASIVLKDGKYKGAHRETRREILGMLKVRGALPSTTMAEALGISSMAVRQHLKELEGSGDVRSTDISQGKGRPTKFWELTEAAERHFADRHRDLILDLLATMEETMGPDGMDRLLEKRGESQIKAYRQRIGETRSLPDQIASLAEIRSEEGYMAEVDREAGGEFLLIENHCPICAAAESCTGLCAVELEVFQKTLGEKARVERVEHILKGSRRCVYRIKQSD